MDIRSVGRYEIRGELGRGNMGVVYRAYDPVIDRPVALKTVILPEFLSESDRNAFLERFFLEARIAGKLLHPNIVVTYDVATDEITGTPFIAMELVEGEALSSRLRREERLPWQQAVAIVVPLALALDHAHQHGVVHRDIKPANILLTSSQAPKIADFGIAKIETSNITQTGVVVGTPHFMSPEQLRGEAVDGRSDLFSLGALLYKMTTGRLPFEGFDIAAVASQVLYKNPPPASEICPDVPESLDRVLAAAMAKAVGQRYSSTAELAQDLTLVGQRANARPRVAAGDKTFETPRIDPTTKPTFKEESEESLAPATVLSKATSRRAILSARLLLLRDQLLSSRQRRITTAALALLFAIGSMAVYFREEIGQQKLFYDARRSMKNGDLLVSERQLEELLERNRGFEGAPELLSEVSGVLVRPSLPLELDVKHSHRVGSCTGRLTLNEQGVDYRSSKHGVWEWSFHQIRAMEARGEWSISLETNEDDMLGLLGTKNYNFALLGARLDQVVWKRYRRLFQYSRSQSPAEP